MPDGGGHATAKQCHTTSMTLMALILTCIGCVGCVVVLYMVADYLMTKEAVVDPGLGSPPFLQTQLCSIKFLCLSDVSDREGQVKGLES